MSYLGLKGLAWGWPLIYCFCLVMWLLDRSYDKKHDDLARSRALKKVARETGLSEEEVEARIASLKKNRSKMNAIKFVKHVSILLSVGFTAFVVWQYLNT